MLFRSVFVITSVLVLCGVLIEHTGVAVLMLFLAAGSLVMTVLLYFQVIAAVVQIVVWIIVFGILWKKMDERYGA